MLQGMAESLTGTTECVIVSNVFCSRMADMSNISLNERMTLVKSIFHIVWIEVRNKEVLRKQVFVLIRENELLSFTRGASV